MFLALKEIQTLVHKVSVSLVLQHLLANLTKNVVVFCFHVSLLLSSLSSISRSKTTSLTYSFRSREE